ncbi:MAG: endolytic transglycosylase MltG [Candidatus Parcubacteria bacterium]|nr:endolytic transglycosylase MltG [Candidatus Parcubacteria bacterium]
MKKFFLLIIFIAFIIGLGWIFKIVFISQAGNNEIKNFTINQGEGVHQISRDLKKEGLIDSSFVFETYLWAIKGGNKILAGEHEINHSWSVRRLVNALISGSDLENERVITILEGWNLRDIVNYFVKEGIIKESDELYGLVGYPGVDYTGNFTLPNPKDFSADYEFLKEKPKNLSLEGYLFPDTYRVYKNSSLEDIIKKMLDNFSQKVVPKMNQGNENLKPDEILTLASIIEKEAKNSLDKRRVAGVYYNRLNLGMALQADPTVNYVTDKITDRPSYDDIATDSLYNTYKYPGLPPGPICNPGLDSILAALYPEKNDYYYFLNTKDGQLIFAKTMAEHQQNRAKYFNN